MEPNIVQNEPKVTSSDVIWKTSVLKMLFLGLSVTLYALVITLVFRNFEVEEGRIKNEPHAGPIVKLLIFGLVASFVIFMVLLGVQADNSWMVDMVSFLVIIYGVYTLFYIIFLPFSVLRPVILVVAISLSVFGALLAVKLRKSHPNSWQPEADFLVLFV